MKSETTIRDFGRIFGGIDQPLWVLTSSHDGSRSGLICTFVMKASIVASMPRVVVGLSHQHYTTALANGSGIFALHLFDETRFDWIRQFGLRSGRDTDKFAGVATTAGEHGAPLLSEAICAIECRVEGRFESGDRSVLLADALTVAWHRGGTPLTTARMLELAPQDLIAELRAAETIDADADAARIAAWRSNV